MANGNAVPEDTVTVLDWTVPRPTGRWHQAIIVTSRHVWVTPELTFADNEKMLAAAAAGMSEFHDFIRGSGWTKRPPRCALGDVRGINWNETTGWMRIAHGDDESIGAMIPSRDAGNALKPLLKRAIGARISNPTRRV